MAKSRERPLNIDELHVLDYDIYELITLHSLKMSKAKNGIIITKSGGIWPILIADIYRTHHISMGDMTIAVKETIKEIGDSSHKFTIFPPWEDYTPTVFMEHLLGTEYQRDSNRERIHRVRKEYLETIIDLTRMGVIDDPFDDENCKLLTALLKEPINILTKDREKVTTVDEALAKARGKDSLKVMFDLYDKFLSEIALSAVS